MKKENLLGLYDRSYARTYNDKFLTNPFSKVSADFEYGVLKGLIHNDTSWLDAGCGTGYFLGKFPGIKRAGMDISPHMLAEARTVNPDALFFREGDFRVDIPEWHGQWSLISSMWYPYSYLESITEVETAVLNMVKWVRPGGTFFLPVADLEDLRPSVPAVPYEKHEEVYGGKICITGYTWTWIEDGGVKHVNMVAPHVEHIIRLLQPFFETIEVVRYPPFNEGWVSRRAIIARNKHVNDGNMAAVIRHAVPGPANAGNTFQAQEFAAGLEQALAFAPHKQLLRELFRRLKNGQTARSVMKRIFGR